MTTGNVVSWKLRQFDNQPSDPTLEPQDPPRPEDKPPMEDFKPGNAYYEKVKYYEPARTDTANILKCPVEAFRPWRWVVRILIHNLDWINEKYINKKWASAGGDPILAGWANATAWFVFGAHGAGEPAQYLLTAAHNVVNPQPPHNDDGKLILKSGEKIVPNAQRARADAVYVIANSGNKQYRGWVDCVSVMSAYLYDPAEGKPSWCRDLAALRIKDSTFPAELFTDAPPVCRMPSVFPVMTTHFIVVGYASKVAQLFKDMCGLYFGRTKRVAGASAEDYDVVQFPGTKIWQNTDGTVSQEKDTLQWERVSKEGTDEGVMSRKGMSGGPGVATIELPGGGRLVVVVSVNVNERNGSIFREVHENIKDGGADPLRLLKAVGATKLVWRGISSSFCGHDKIGDFNGAFWMVQEDH